MLLFPTCGWLVKLKIKLVNVFLKNVCYELVEETIIVSGIQQIARNVSYSLIGAIGYNNSLVGFFKKTILKKKQNNILYFIARQIFAPVRTSLAPSRTVRS